MKKIPGQSTSTHVVVVGGGYTGLSAAYDLTKAGYKVSVYEADAALGGLAGTFELTPGVRIEKFYHHWFSSDVDILDLIEEIGLSENVKYLPSNTGLYFANSIFRLASPLDLLKFKPLPFVDRVRTGLMALIARRINDWIPLENESAADWIKRYAGQKSFNTIWGPLLKGKFGREADNISAVWFWNKLKLRGSSRNKKGGETLLYFDGGFQKVTEGIANKIREQGGEIFTSTPVTKIKSENGKVIGIEIKAGFVPADTVLATPPIPIFLNITENLPDSYINQGNQIRFLGNVCLILGLKKSLSSTYWLNVSDPSFPFVGVIEHTNLDPKENYKGLHIAYISKYLGTDEALFNYSDKDYFEYCIPYIKKIFPEFTPDWVEHYACWRAHYSQPVITKHYSKNIPSVRTPIEGLWLSSMAQIYPEDRGTNYAIREGRKVAKMIGG